MIRDINLNDIESNIYLKYCECINGCDYLNNIIISIIDKYGFNELRNKSRKQTLNKMLKVVLLNLCILQKYKFKQIKCPRSNQYWVKNNAYNYWNFSYEFVKCLDLLESYGLIDILIGGFFSRKEMPTKYEPSRFAPTEEFLQKYINELSEKIEIQEIPFPIRVHKKLRWREDAKEEGKTYRYRDKKIAIPIEVTEEKVNQFNNTLQYRFNVSRQGKVINEYNQFLDGFTFSLSENMPKEKIEMYQECRQNNANSFVGGSMYRVFNYKDAKKGKNKEKEHWFKHGGRWYGHWIQVLYNKRPDSKGQPAKLRSYVLIDGKPTVELDYKCLHANMLYALSGAYRDPEADIYDIPGQDIPRKICKLAMLIVFNATGLKQAALALGNEMEKYDPDNVPSLNERIRILTAIQKANEPIENHFFSGVGTILQNIDSYIATKVMMAFKEENKPCIPIHDSFIVWKEDKELLRKIMLEEYQKALKTDNIIGID